MCTVHAIELGGGGGDHWKAEFSGRERERRENATEGLLRLEQLHEEGGMVMKIQ